MAVEPKDRIIVALDVDTLKEANTLVEQLYAYVGWFKVGLQLLHSEGTPNVVKTLKNSGGRIFADTKMHDIPNTVGKAVKAVSNHGADMFNVMASGGIDMMMKAVENKGASLALAVTVLTSLEENDAYLLLGGPTKAKVLQYSRDAKLSGMNGIVCSPLEVELLKKRKELAGLIYVTPGIRLEGGEVHDQKRIKTPYGAIMKGADYLVIGRAITEASESEGGPVGAVEKVISEIEAALKDREEKK